MKVARACVCAVGTASACLVGAFTGLDAHQVTGRGTGFDDAMLVHKCEVVQIALRRHRPDPYDAAGTLAAVGGFEHAALAGLICAAAVDRVPLALDGVVATAAALAAVGVCLQVAGYLSPGRCSTESAADVALDQSGLAPLLDLQYRAGRALPLDALAHSTVPPSARTGHPVAFTTASVRSSAMSE